MKFFLTAFAALLLCGQSAFAQQTTEISVSMKTSDGKFVGMTAGGGLDASADTISAKQTFTLLDLNGGKIADGDAVKIKFDASQWREDKENSRVHRVPTKGAKENEGVFKLRVKEKLIYFETPAGKFVKIADGAVTTTSDAKNASLFDVQTVVPASEPVSYPVAFKLANGNHLGMVAGGGLDAAAKEISDKQIFTMIDVNGGTLSSGDSVKIVYGESQMREDAGAKKIHRVPTRGAKAEECVFKLLVVKQNIRLQTPSGKFVAAAPDGKSLLAADKEDETSLLTAVPNPTPTIKK